MMSARVHRQGALGPVRVLLLEDSLPDAQLIEAALTAGDLAFELKRVDTEAAFVEALGSGEWAVVLSDYNVPSFDGADALALARERWPQVPFIFVTGALGDERAVALLKRGATDYILKDRLDKLASCVRRALDEARERARLQAAELALEESRARQAELEKQLIGIVSHDLRNPLSVVSLATMTALRDESLPASVTRNLLRIQTATDRMSRMISDLLDFTHARIGGSIKIDRGLMNIAHVSRETADELEVTHPGRTIAIETKGDLRGQWDRDRLAQVFENLILNALRFSSPTSTVTVRCDGSGDSVVVTVHNEGEPIPDALHARLFQPFFQVDGVADRTRRSVGLGLFIVDQIVRAHGGTVTLRSASGEGTTFEFTVPRGEP